MSSIVTQHGGHIFKGQKRFSSWTFSTLEHGTIALSQNTTHQLPSDVAHIPEERGSRPLISLPESQTEDILDRSRSVPAVSSYTV